MRNGTQNLNLKPQNSFWPQKHENTKSHGMLVLTLRTSVSFGVLVILWQKMKNEK